MKYTNDLRLLTDIVTKINRSQSEIYFVDKCEELFCALETIVGVYIGYAKANNMLSDWAKKQTALSINSKISETVNSILTSEQKRALFELTIFKEIIHFKPLIMSDEVLENYRYNPFEISETLRELATEPHRRLIDAYNYRKPNTDILISKLCKLLYGVRSNLKHYGKTPFGPDSDKCGRDETVCKLIYPVLFHLIDILLDEPSKKLLVYGTLKVGLANSKLIDELRNEIVSAFIWGFLEEEDNLLSYTFSISSLMNRIPVELIFNNSLPMVFEKLDRFEGKKYLRILVPFDFNGNILIGNIYTKNKNL